jgi:hypothetical protein
MQFLKNLVDELTMPTSNIRLLFATDAFGLGVDIPDVELFTLVHRAIWKVKVKNITLKIYFHLCSFVTLFI